MDILFFFVIGVFFLLSLGILTVSFRQQFAQKGLLIGGLSYLSGAILAMTLSSWWPLLGGFLLAFVIRLFSQQAS